MTPESFLTTSAEIGIGIAGFAGIASVLGYQGRDGWTPGHGTAEPAISTAPPHRRVHQGASLRNTTSRTLPILRDGRLEILASTSRVGAGCMRSGFW